MQSVDAKLSLLATVELAIEAPADAATPGKVTLRASDIDALTARLALIRSTMAPEIPRALATDSEVSKVVDPLWMLHSPIAVQEKLLAIRHPGLGWLMFQLPAPEAARLGHALLSCAPSSVSAEQSSVSTEQPSNSLH